MSELDRALDDIDGLQETFAALGDARRRSALLREPEQARLLQREVAAAADAYAAALMSTPRGAFDAARLRRCRSAATRAMPLAVRRRRELAALVEERRVHVPRWRDDVQALLELSLHCRAALDSFAPTVARREAEALGNKILVELRSATLQYLAVARDAGDVDPGRPRSAVAELLRKSQSHASGLAALAPEPDVAGFEPSLGSSLARTVAEELHDTSVRWQAA